MIPSPSQPAPSEAKRRRAADLWFSVCSLARIVFPALATTACLFLLSFVTWFRIPSPFAAAMLPARRERPGIFALLGLILGIVFRLVLGLSLDIWQYIGCGCLWLLLQTWRPSPGIATALAAGGALVPRAVAAFIMSGWWNGLLSTAAIPLGIVSAFVLRHGFDQWKECCAQPRARERWAVQLLSLLLIAALGFFRIGSINLRFLAAVIATIAAASVNNSTFGTAAGLFCGLALALNGHSSHTTVMLSLCGLGCGLPFVTRRRWLSVPVALFTGILTSYMTPGQEVSYLAIFVGSLLCTLSPKSLRTKAELFLSAALPGDARMENDFVNQRITHLREAMEKIALALPRPAAPSLSDGETLGTLLCAQCANRELCWGRSRSSTDRMLSLSMEMARKGQNISEDSLPALEQHGCLRSEAIDETASRALIAQKKQRLRLSRQEYEQTLTLAHLAAMSGTLNDLNMLTAGRSVGDLQAAHVINRAIDELRLSAKLHYARRVDGHLQAALTLDSLLPTHRSLDALLRYLSEAENLSLSISRAERGRIELEETPLYSATVGTASLCAGEAAGTQQAVCGDACAAQRCEGGRLLMVLCDGMGHGEAAHAQSEKTLELLLLLLEAGYSRRQAITAVNGIMLSASSDEESFTTVDLCDIDLWTGEVICEKLGACATWVVRGNHLKKVEAASLPLGIVEEARPSHVEYRLHSGDILVMMSDGVADAFRDEDELRHALDDSLYIQPQRMADALIRNALLASGDTPRDDMTVMVMLMMDQQRGTVSMNKHYV